MSRTSVLLAASVAATACGLVTACGTSHPAKKAATTSAATTNPTTTAGAQTSTALNPPTPLTPEAEQAAAGDIPDNQVFLVFRNGRGGYSMKYPEGWAQRGTARGVSFRDKNNLVGVAVRSGGAVTVAAARAEMRLLERQTPTLRLQSASEVTVGGKQAVRVVYSTRSAPNTVTGKSVTLVVDRYYIPGAGKHAVVDLGTPAGVDNVDAYRLMIESFRWR